MRPLLLTLILACDAIAPIETGTVNCSPESPCDSGRVCFRGACVQLQNTCNGDGVVQLGEECDDGNLVNDDACTNACTIAYCGDGIVRRDLSVNALGYEDCEPGSEPGANHCADHCRQAAPFRQLATTYSLSCAFVSSSLRCWGSYANQGGDVSAVLIAPFAVELDEPPVDLRLHGGYHRSNDFDLYHRDATGLTQTIRLTPNATEVQQENLANTFVEHNYLAADVCFRGCSVTSAGAVVCNGDNRCGQTLPLDRPPTPNSTNEWLGYAVRVDGVDSARAVAVGETTTCAVTTDGSVWCWGAIDDWPRRPSGACERVRTVTRMPGLEDVIAITANRFGYTGLTEQGSAISWGRDWRGARLEQPVERVLPEPALQIGASNTSECILFASGRVGCWGEYRGVDGAASDDLAYVEGLDDVIELSDGRSADHFCARRANDEIWCWGDNSRGQLGDGTREPRSTPIRVLGL